VLDLSRLTSEQRQAVLALDGPLLIVAGPGSGKTMVLAAKIAYLVGWRQIPPTSILALTFATKAARELRARLVGLLGEQGAAVDVSTFHALGLRIVRQWSEEVGLGPDPPVIYAEHEARALLREVAEEREIDLSQVPLIQLAGALQQYRLDGDVAAQHVAELHSLAEAYEEALHRRGGVDYPGMLALPLRLFTQHPGALRLCQDAYRVILVDEFQDVCAAQYALLRHLSARHHNLIVVGDPRQSLYGWRGAGAHFMDEFRSDFPEARTVSLSQNFRSTAQIVDLANALGAALPYGRLWTDNPGGEVVQLRAAMDERDEAAFVAGEIERLVAAHVIDRLGEIAILYRTNQQALPLTMALRDHGLAHRVQGSGDLFARREVRDLVAYLRLAHNPDDALALARVVNVPPRRLARLADLLREKPVAAKGLPDAARPFGTAAVAKAESLVALIETLHFESSGKSMADLVDRTLDRTGYATWLESQPDGEVRLAGLHAFRAVAARTEDDLGTWLANLQLDEEAGPGIDDGCRVLLSTIHKAKGGEWRVVFVVGMEEGLLPHARALAAQEAKPDGIDEELSVAYVAVTRARERLYITHCQARHRGDRCESRHPSCFLRGLPLERLERTA